ncbi:ribonucleases P/MRP protein subunit POP1 [Wyeomyia smithii]|uniref:ribonucleases P/MRP protein subunit POP1 n=1 Tax=Wyeomyia smithii TaxID=174621 RepID=UPI002467ED6A|nr:ribonucleases P/MRP protein subunit POP1 [Wyeomyia smithii]
MESNLLCYDESHDGRVQLQNEVDSSQFNEERITEMKTMLRTMANTEKQTKLMHQSLPLHMRRRAMTYNPKRLPRKFRAIHLAQFNKSGLPEKKKRPSRKYRRKANVLLKEYERRKKTNVWLETHIWHAKRFHMLTKWGYKIPYTATAKSYRACYRATAKHCLLQDISYYGCIEIQGEESLLRSKLKEFCSEKVGLTIAAKAFLNGRRSGYIWLYEKNQYPFQCIGRVRFVWKANDAREKRTLWIFAHPIFYSKLVKHLVDAFDLKNTVFTPMDMNEPETTADTIPPRMVRTPKYVNNSLGVVILELKDTLNYFRLTGPLSHVTLSKALNIYPVSNASQSSHWYSDWIQCPINKRTAIEQLAFWDKVKHVTSTGEFGPGVVIGLVVEDPRLNRPNKRTKALPPTLVVPQHSFPDCTTQTALSPLWDSTIRDRIVKEMQTTHELNQLREKQCLVPGEKCAFENSIQPIPLLLIQNTGSQDGEFKRLGYGTGWDLIAPAGYGLALWQTLIIWGAKPAGLKEFDMQALEAGTDANMIPDTVLGQNEADFEYNKKLEKYFSRPHNRRVNYKKLAIASPFRSLWSQLVSEWNASKNSKFYVLRDQESLNKIHLSLDRKYNIKSVDLPPVCLVPVYLTIKTRGNPGDNALICLPHRQDFRQNKSQTQINDNGPVLVEPLRKDPFQKERHQLRKMHLRQLKRLRKRRIREKKNRQRKQPGTLVRIAKPQNRNLIQEQLAKMKELWLPAVPETIRNQCSRECFGYVTRTSFSLIEGKVTAVGYVTSRGLEKLFRICTKGSFKVLIRGTKTRCYRFATLKVRLE